MSCHSLRVSALLTCPVSSGEAKIIKERFIESSFVERKSVDKDSENPKICSSLTENQAAVLEYICQVRFEKIERFIKTFRQSFEVQ